MKSCLGQLETRSLCEKAFVLGNILNIHIEVCDSDNNHVQLPHGFGCCHSWGKKNICFGNKGELFGSVKCFHQPIATEAIAKCHILSIISSISGHFEKVEKSDVDILTPSKGWDEKFYNVKLRFLAIKTGEWVRKGHKKWGGTRPTFPGPVCSGAWRECSAKDESSEHTFWCHALPRISGLADWDHGQSFGLSLRSAKFMPDKWIVLMYEWEPAGCWPVWRRSDTFRPNVDVTAAGRDYM